MNSGRPNDDINAFVLYLLCCFLLFVLRYFIINNFLLVEAGAAVDSSGYTEC